MYCRSRRWARGTKALLFVFVLDRALSAPTEQRTAHKIYECLDVELMVTLALGLELRGVRFFTVSFVGLGVT